MKKTVWEKWEKICHWAGDFNEADGFAYLVYADSADHSIYKGCNPVIFDDDLDKNEGRMWVAHVHPGAFAVGATAPEALMNGCRGSRRGYVCIGGKTAEEAILRAWELVHGREVPEPPRDPEIVKRENEMLAKWSSTQMQEWMESMVDD